MARPPPAFVAVLTRLKLAQMLAPTYAKLRDIDVNDAYRRLDPALRQLPLIEGLQAAAWEAALAERPEDAPDALLARISKKLEKPRRYKPAAWRSAEEGAWLAWSMVVDRGAGVASGEALDLLETDRGRKLAAQGIEAAGLHLARELLR